MHNAVCYSASGQVIDFTNLSLASVTIEDVARGLAAMPRWTGQTQWSLHPYTVAQHSVNVCYHVHERGGTHEEQLCALLHDAFEAYGCDVPTPLKNLIPGYKDIEKQCLSVIFEALGVPKEWAYDLPQIVKEADYAVLCAEARDLCAPVVAQGLEIDKAYARAVTRAWAPTDAYHEFLEMFDALHTKVRIVV